MSATTPTTHLRSLYRSLLRELPVRPKNQAPSVLRSSIRQQFFTESSASSNASSEYALARRQEAEQFVQYMKAQRMYCTLIERYNSGWKMDDDERIRLTARRVGMEMPEEWYGDLDGKGKKEK